MDELEMISYFLGTLSENDLSRVTSQWDDTDIIHEEEMILAW